MKKYFAFAMLVFIYSCDYKEPETQYIQLTSDDFSYLICNVDTILVTSEDFYYTDTIQYLYNRTSVVNAVITTSIQTYKPQLSLIDIYYVYGRTTYDFLNCPTFKSAEIIVRRNTDYGNSEQLFSVILNGKSWQKMINYSEDSVTALDTANVLGYKYQGVLNFQPYIENQSIFKTIMFAKKTGFIKIETLEGDLLERIME